MGLDGVELVMAWEERFGIEIPAADATGLATTRDAVDYVWSRLAALRDPCPTRRVFQAMRRCLGPLVERPRPSTSLAALAVGDRHAAWARMRGEFARVPRLRRSVVERVAIGIATIAAGALAFAAVPWGGVSLAGVAAFAFASATTGAVAAELTARIPLVRPLPDGMHTFGDLARRIAGPPPPPGGWTRDAVRTAVRAVVSRQLGVTDWSDDDSFVDDLGLD